jgi:hypothetical protein
MAEYIGLIGGVIGIIGAAAGFFAWYASNVKKSYAAERDFGHIKRNLEQMSLNVAELDKHNNQFSEYVRDEVKGELVNIKQSLEVIKLSIQRIELQK